MRLRDTQKPQRTVVGPVGSTLVMAIMPLLLGACCALLLSYMSLRIVVLVRKNVRCITLVEEVD
jgi:hypothetical protein